MNARVAGLLSCLDQHSTEDSTELAYLRRVIALLRDTPEPLVRHQYTPGHVTASAYVLDKGLSHVLLIYHSKLHRWLQPGGHVEATDVDIEAAARREVREETALIDLELLGGGPLDVDVHQIPARGDNPAHCHYDVRFLFRACRGDAEAGSDAEAVRWVPLTKVDEVETDESVMRAVRKIRRRVEGEALDRWCLDEIERTTSRLEVSPSFPRICREWLVGRYEAHTDRKAYPQLLIDGARAGLFSLNSASLPPWVVHELHGRDCMRSRSTDRARIAFEEAIEAVPDEEVAQRAWLWGLLGHARSADGHHARSARAWQQALELSLQAGRVDEANLCRTELAWCYAHLRQRGDAEKWAGYLANGANGPLHLRAASLRLMLGGAWSDYRDAANGALLRTLWSGRRTDQSDGLFQAARLAFDYGQTEDALRWIEAAAATAAVIGDAVRQENARAFGMRMCLLQTSAETFEGLYFRLWRAERLLREGDARTAQREAYRVLAIAEEAGHPLEQLDASLLLGTIRLYRGDAADALPRFERCRRMYAERLHSVGESLMCSMIVVCEALLGQHQQASHRSMEVRLHPDAAYTERLALVAERVLEVLAREELLSLDCARLEPLGFDERLELAVLRGWHEWLQEAS